MKNLPTKSPDNGRAGALPPPNLLRNTFKGVSAIIMLAALLTLNACNGNENQTAAIACDEGGVKIGGSQTCENPSDCSEYSCLPGYKCQADNSCGAEFACKTNTDCSSDFATCEAGACINPKRCTEDAHCLNGYQCSNNKCVVSQCNQRCDRGYCDAETGSCKSKDSCTEATEKKDCLVGEMCYKGQCKTSTQICNDLNCSEKRGVCDLDSSREKCVNAPESSPCVGLNDCTEGYFCNTSSTSARCEENKCEATGVCPAGGICVDSATGDCDDKDSCEKSEDCVGGVSLSRVCVKGVKGNVCVEKNNICDTACPGNQLCEITDSTQLQDSSLVVTPTCKENNVCYQKEDCIGDTKVCYNNSCIENTDASITCEDDPFESNDNKTSATDYGKVKNAVLNLCGSHPDYYKIDTNSISSSIGKLSIAVSIEASDFQNKKATIKLYHNEDAPITLHNTYDANTSTYQQYVKIERSIAESDKGIYYLAVEKEEGEDNLPFRYSIDVGISSNNIDTICDENLKTLKTNETLEGEINTNWLEPSCSKGSTTKDDVWKFDVEDSIGSYTFKVEPKDGSNADLTLSLRKFCKIKDSELPGKCVNNVAAGSEEEYSTTLEKGTYYVVVSSDIDTQYTIKAEKHKIACSYKDNVCKKHTITTTDASGTETTQEVYKQELCNSSLTDIVATECPFQTEDTACNAEKTACKPTEGDVCGKAFEVSRGKPVVKISHSIAGSSNSYDPNTQCSVISNTNATSGKDTVLKATLKTGEVFVVRAKSTQAPLTIYMSSDCNISDSCAAGTTGTGVDEVVEAHYTNTSNEDKTIFAFIDYNGVNQVDTISFGGWVLPQQCTPSQKICIKDGAESIVCNSKGTGYESRTICPYGCHSDVQSAENYGACKTSPYDTCIPASEKDNKQAFIDATGINKTTPLQKQFTEHFNVLTDTVTRGDFWCGGIGQYILGGKDAIYSILLKPNSSANIEVSSAHDLILWAVDGGVDGTQSCTLVDDQYVLTNNKCVAASNTSTTDKENISLVNTSSGNRVYYVVVEPAYKDSVTTDVTFEIDILVKEFQSEKYNEVKSCSGNTLTYYDHLGVEQTLSCTCDGDRCNESTPNIGDFCYLPHVLKGASGTVPEQSLNNSYTNTFGTIYPIVDKCLFDNIKYPNGNEAIYRFSLEANKTLTIDFKGEDNIATFFQKDKCGISTNGEISCFGAIHGLGSRVLNYKAEKAEEIFFVVKQFERTSADKFSFTWEIKDLTCAPNTVYCESDKKLVRCNQDGTQKTEITCDCEADRCTLPVEENSEGQRCDDPLELDENGGVYYISSLNYRNNTNDIETSCVKSQREDTFFRYSNTSGKAKVVVATAYPVSTGSYPSIALAPSCDDIRNGNSKCVGSTEVEPKFTKPVSLTKRVENGESLIFMIDESASYSWMRHADIYVVFEVKDVECDDSSFTPICEGKSLKFCKNSAFLFFDCGSTSTCESDPEPHCQSDTQTGITCFDAKDIVELAKKTNAGTDTKGKISDFLASGISHDLISPKLQGSQFSGQCLFKRPPAAGETYYSVKLEKDDILSVTLSFNGFDYWSSNAQLYIIDGCITNQECLAGEAELLPEERKARFQAKKTGTYYIVVDSYRVETKPVEYFIEYDIEKASPNCVPFQAFCTDDTTIQLCTAEGELQSATCPGKCEEGRCTVVAADINTCSSALSLTSVAGQHVHYPITVPFSRGIYTQEIEIPNKNIEKVKGYYRQLKDAFFNLGSLKKGSSINIDIYHIDDGVNPVVYLMKDGCGLDKIVVAKTEAEDGTGPAKLLSYEIEEDGNYYLGVTSYSSSTKQEDPVLFIDILPSNCSPDTFTNMCNTDGDKLIYCNPLNVRDEYTCAGGCNSGKCNTPTGNICLDPFNVTFDATNSFTVTKSMASAFNTEDPGNSNICTLLPQPGPDHFYEVTVDAGQMITATVESGDDVSLYLTTDCQQATAHCLAGADVNPAGQSETIHYTNTTTSAQTLILIVDSVNPSSKGDYTLRVSRQ